MNGLTLMLEQPGGREILAAWGILLLAVLLTVYAYLSRKGASRAAALVLCGTLFAVAAGPPAVLVAYLVPALALRIEPLNETAARVERESREARDAALACQRENAILNEMVRGLRARTAEPEGRVEQGTPGTAGAKDAAAAGGPAAARAGEGREAEPEERLSRAEQLARQWIQPRASNARYRVAIRTPENNRRLAQNLQEKLKHLRFQTDGTEFAEVSGNRVVYHSEADYRRAAYLVWLLEYQYKMNVPLDLNLDEEKQGLLQIHLMP